MQIINLTNTLFRAKPSYCKLKPDSNVNIKEIFYIDVNNFLNGKCNAYDYLTNFKNNLRALKNCKDFNETERSYIQLMEQTIDETDNLHCLPDGYLKWLMKDLIKEK